MAKIIIENLSKSYKIGDKNLQVIDNFSLDIKEGEFITLFGPNGSGKTTLLNLIAGILNYDQGKILIDSKQPFEAKTSMIFQNYDESLMPWLTCKENILFPLNLKIRKSEKHFGEKRFLEILEELNIDLPMNNYIYELSGGQKQLTAILRTLIYKPDVILMDEPFSSLDFKTRAFIQLVLLDIWEKEKPTIIFVSHDIEEAIFLADRLVLLNPLPTSVNSIIDIPFIRPRSKILFKNKDFYQLKMKCLKLMEEPKI